MIQRSRFISKSSVALHRLQRGKRRHFRPFQSVACACEAVVADFRSRVICVVVVWQFCDLSFDT